MNQESCDELSAALGRVEADLCKRRAAIKAALETLPALKVTGGTPSWPAGCECKLMEFWSWLRGEELRAIDALNSLAETQTRTRLVAAAVGDRP